MTNEYEFLVEIVGNARILAALSDNEEVTENALSIKDAGISAAKALGVSEDEFRRDTVARFMELKEDVR